MDTKKLCFVFMLGGGTFLKALEASPAMVTDLGETKVIMGGGAAGSSAAYYLGKKGLKSMIFEASDRLGGKCHSSVCEGYVIDQGAIQLPDSYIRTKKLVKKFQLTTFPSPPLIFMTGNQENKALVAHFRTWNFIKAYISYSLQALKYDVILTDLSLVEDYPEIQVSISEYLRNNGLEPMEPIFQVIMTAYGYGSLREIPMYHGFCMFPLRQALSLGFLQVPVLGGFLAEPTSLIKEGYEALMEKLVESSGAEVRLKESIEMIWPQEQGVLFKTSKGLYKAKNLIITVPPSFKYGVRYQSPYWQEKFNFLQESLVYVPYGTTLFHTADSLPRDLLIHENFKGYEPTMIGVKGEGCPVAISYSYGRTKDSASIKQLLKEYWAELGKQEALEILDQKQFDTYYPHPKTEAVEKGFYSVLKKMQGRENIFFCGSWTTFEIVERTIEASRLLVKTYFNEPREHTPVVTKPII